MTTVETLIAVRELLADEDRWCQGSVAKNKWGVSVDVNAPNACRWCLAGAIAKQLPKATYSWEDLEPYALLLGFQSAWLLTGFNDSELTSHADVLARIDRKINELSSKEKETA